MCRQPARCRPQPAENFDLKISIKSKYCLSVGRRRQQGTDCLTCARRQGVLLRRAKHILSDCSARCGRCLAPNCAPCRRVWQTAGETCAPRHGGIGRAVLASLNKSRTPVFKGWCRHFMGSVATGFDETIRNRIDEQARAVLLWRHSRPLQITRQRASPVCITPCIRKPSTANLWLQAGLGQAFGRVTAPGFGPWAGGAGQAGLVVHRLSQLIKPKKSPGF